MSDFIVKPLDESTWPDFARLVEKHNGVWGGCWCISFHPEGYERNRTAAKNRIRRLESGKDEETPLRDVLCKDDWSCRDLYPPKKLKRRNCHESFEDLATHVGLHPRWQRN